MNADWTTPEPAEVQILVGSLTDENLKRLFFVELQNPNWLGPLAALGMFAAEPQPWADDAGLQHPRPWPEGEYLARVAVDEPDAVTDLLVGHAASQNPWVQRTVLQAALALPAGQAVRLVPQIAKAIRSGYDWVDANTVVKLAEALAATHPRQAQTLLTSAFGPRTDDGEAAVRRGRSGTGVASSIDPYWFRELTPRVVSLLKGLGLDGLKSAAGWLNRALDTAPAGGATADSSHFWRPSIAPSSQNSDLYDISDALVDIVRDTATKLATAGSLREVTDFLEARDRVIFARDRS